MHGGASDSPAMGPAAVAGFVRRVRVMAGLSQRELARRVGVAPSTVGRIEAGTVVPRPEVLDRILAVADLRLAVVDAAGAVVSPLPEEELRDGAGRHYPAHLEVIVDPDASQWWGTKHAYAPGPPDVTFRLRRDTPWEDRPYRVWPVGFRRRRKRR